MTAWALQNGDLFKYAKGNTTFYDEVKKNNVKI